MENYMKILRVLNLLSDFDLLIPEQHPSLTELLKGKPKRQRAPKQKKDCEWKWGDEI